jgi:hypothetical protein
MAELRRDVENFIKDLHAKTSDGNVPFNDAFYSEIENKIKATASGNNNQTSNLAKLALQTIAQFGIKSLLQAVFNENKTTDQRINEIESVVVKAGEGNIKSSSGFDVFQSYVKKYFLNFMNNWIVSFGNNKQIQDPFIYDLMSVYTRSVTFPTIDINTESQPLQYTKNEDIEMIDYGEVSFTIMLDRDMVLYKNLLKVIKKMRNPKTGRYGYREDYRFDFIEIGVFDSGNFNIMSIKLEDAIIKAISAPNLTQEQATLQEVTFTVIYDRLLIDE